MKALFRIITVLFLVTGVIRAVEPTFSETLDIGSIEAIHENNRKQSVRYLIIRSIKTEGGWANLLPVPQGTIPADVDLCAFLTQKTKEFLDSRLPFVDSTKECLLEVATIDRVGGLIYLSTNQFWFTETNNVVRYPQSVTVFKLELLDYIRYYVPGVTRVDVYIAQDDVTFSSTNRNNYPQLNVESNNITFDLIRWLAGIPWPDSYVQIWKGAASARYSMVTGKKLPPLTLQIKVEIVRIPAPIARITVTGEAGKTIAIESSTDLKVWQTIYMSNSHVYGEFTWEDTAPSQAMKIYRAKY